MKRHLTTAILVAICITAIATTALFTGCKDDDEVKVIHDTVTVINTNYDTIVNIKENNEVKIIYDTVTVINTNYDTIVKIKDSETFFIVSYSSEYGTLPGSVIVRQEGKLAEKDLRPISADGHTFLGWFLDDKKVESGFSVTSDLTLTAQWSDETYQFFLDDKSAKLDDNYDLKSGRHTIKVTGTMTPVLYSQIATALRDNPDVQFDVDMGETEGLKVAADKYYDKYEYIGFGEDASHLKYVLNLLSIVLPKSLESISDYAFASCEKLEKVSFPDGLIEIGQYSFYGTNLSEVNIPSSVNKMAGNAFTNCSKLKSLDIPMNTREVGLFGMNSLTSITIPSTVTNISLSSAPLLKELTLPKNTTKITITDCNNLTSLSLPDGIKYVHLSECSNLSSLNIPEGVESLRLSSCGVVSISFPESLTELQISDCKNITVTEVTIPKNVIGSLVCWPSLTSLTILTNNYFHYSLSSSLKNVIYGQNVSEITYLFVDIFEGITITIQSTTPPTLQYYRSLLPSTIIKVPASAVDAYKTAENWSQYADLIVGY